MKIFIDGIKYNDGSVVYDSEKDEMRIDTTPKEEGSIYATELDDNFYYIGQVNNVRFWNVSSEIGKRKMREGGNAFKKREDAEDQARAEKLMRQLKMYADRHKNKVKPQNKYYIIYSSETRTISVAVSEQFLPFGSILFDSWEIANNAINEFMEELTWYFTEYLR